MVRHVIVLGLLTGTGLAAAAAQQAPPQTPPQTPVFRGGTVIVPLDITVIDKDGKSVTDLAQADFTVFENNVKQDIRSFFPQAFTPQPPAAPGVAPIHARWSDTVAPQQRRMFLIVLGFGRIQVPARGVDGALAFVREHLLPQDLVAVIGFNRATEFTTDHEEIARTIERYKQVHEQLVFDIQESRIFSHDATLPATIQERMDAIFTGVPAPGDRRQAGSPPAAPSTLPPPRSVTQMLLGMDTRASSLNEKPWNRQETLSDVQRSAGNANVTMADAVAMADLYKIYAGIEYLRSFDGEKHLVYVGAGLGAMAAEADRRLAARANDARVVMDLTHTGGNSGDFAAIAAAEEIAELTGGHFTSVSYVDKALARVDSDARFSYLLGYAPTNPTLDGTYRKVNVTVNRPGVRVLFHHGYYAAEDLAPVDMKETIIDSRLASAGAYAQPADDIKLSVRAAPALRLGAVGQMRVDVTIEARRLAFATTPDGRTATVEVQIFCGDAKEKLVGDVRRRLELSADEETYRSWLKDGIPFTTRVPVTDAVKFVKVVAYDYAADLLGMVFLKIGK